MPAFPTGVGEHGPYTRHVSDLIELFETSYFQVGLRFGLLALGVGWLLVVLARRRGVLPIVGLLIAGSTFTALFVLEVQVGIETISILVVVLGVALARGLKAPDLLVPLGALPGSVWLALSTEVTDLVWVRVAMALLIPVAGYLTSDFERRYAGMGLGVIFFALASLGVFVAVPDTEWSRVLIAVAVPVTFLAWPKAVATLGVEGSYAAIATFLVVTSQGGGARPASIVGGFACLGLLLMEPLTMAFRPEVVRIIGWIKRNWAGAVLASLPQFVVVALCSRVAARFTNELPALIVVAAVYGATIAVGISAASRDGEERRAT